MEKGKIFIISGPSGSGKTTLYKKLLEDRDLKKKIVKTTSMTTRAIRPGEADGRDYFFISTEMFFYKKRARHFLESEKVFDNYYGTPRKQVVDFLAKGKNVLLCIDVKGAKTVCQQFPAAIRIFIKTSSFKILKERLGKRGSEAQAAMKTRLETAHQELKEAHHYNYIIINDKLDKAARQLKKIVSQEIGI